MVEMEKFMAKANALARQFDANRSAIADYLELRVLTEDAAAAALEMSRERYDRAVAAVQSEAQTALDRATEALGPARLKLREAEIQKLRDTVGDVVAADIYRRKIALMSPEEALDVYTFGTEWEQALLAGFREIGTEEADQKLQEAIDQARGPEYRELEIHARQTAEQENLIPELDPIGFREMMQAEYGLAKPPPLPGGLLTEMEMQAAKMRVTRWVTAIDQAKRRRGGRDMAQV